jgi:hypothetical protein
MHEYPNSMASYKYIRPQRNGEAKQIQMEKITDSKQIKTALDNRCGRLLGRFLFVIFGHFDFGFVWDLGFRI